MRIIYQRCCGLDVHKKVIMACLLLLEPDGELRQEVRKFGTMTKDLLALLDWLQQAGCTHVAMESTGVYWKPIYNILEGQLEVVVVNAQHLKGVPGRKTDVMDSEWLAECYQLGLLRPSFIPPAPVREVRDLTRYRTSLIEIVRAPSTGCRRCWRMPISNWPGWSRISRAYRLGPCCKRSWLATPIQKHWRTWPKGCSEKNESNWSPRFLAG